MQPVAVAEFISAYTVEVNGQRGAETADRARVVSERASIARKLEGLYDAIAEGLRTPGLKARLGELDVTLSAAAPSPVRLHPNLSEMYRKKAAELTAMLADPEIRTAALEIIRGPITRVTVQDGPEGLTLGLEGALTAMTAWRKTTKARLGAGWMVEL